jgi:hypothetical protein
MAAIFGYLNKEEKNPIISSIISELTLNRVRPIKEWAGNNMFLSHVQHPGTKSPTIAQTPTGSFIGVMDGDIYNQAQLQNDLLSKKKICTASQDSTALILLLFEQYGADIFSKINGNFAIAIWNQHKKELTLVSDKFGLSPLFIYDSFDAFIFCSEYQPILSHKSFNNSLNHTAIAEYFYLGFTLGTKTFFNDIHSFPAASILTIDNKHKILNTYTSLEIPIEKNKSISYYAEKINSSFRSAVNQRKETIHTCSLSGGLDTRYILGTLSPEDRKRFSFITYQSAHLTSYEEKDVICANILAKYFNLSHTLKRRPEHAFNGNYFDFMRSKIIQGCLWGHFGGELLGGYYQQLFLYNRLPETNDSYYNNILPSFFSKQFIRKIPDITELCTYAKYHNQQKENQVSLEQNTWLLFAINILTRSFYTSIYKGVFGRWLYPRWFFMNHWRFPFLDQNFLTALLTVPPTYLANNTLYLTIMHQFHPVMLSFPLSSNQINKPDPRINFCNKGKYWYSVQKKIYNTQMKRYLWHHSAFVSHNFSFSHRINIYIKGLLLTVFNEKSIGYLGDSLKSNLKNTDIVKFLQFEAWLHKYYVYK